VVMGRRKVGGVLAETSMSGGRIREAVLSIGLNVNVTVHDLPEEVWPTAGSLREAGGHDYQLETVAARTLDQLERRWPMMSGGGEELAEAWRRRDVLAGRQVVVGAAGGVLRGMADGIDGAGALRLVAEDRTLTVTVGEAKEVRIEDR
jgi:BirA family biotin operon repressor/biotin-[acetyl-CoA-carboxylase] ligase